MQIDVHPTIDASPGSNSLKEHLASIVKLDASQLETAKEDLKPEPILPYAPSILDVAGVPETETNTDLKSDASFYYGGYRGYGQPFYGNPYYSNYWSYGNYYNRPYYHHYPYGYYRHNDYYPGR